MNLNSKQIVAGASAIILVIILVYPALSTGTVSVVARSTGIQTANHVYVTVNRVWAHKRGQTTSSGWTIISNQSQGVDLISLVTSPMPLGSGQVPIASYDAVRVEISNVTWVFNKTTTRLAIVSPQLDSNLDFTTQVGRSVSITILLGGREEVLGTQKFFAATLNVTLTGSPSTG